jgi:hypothetical protein
MLDHIIPLNEQHLRRLVRKYVNYYHEDRITILWKGCDESATGREEAFLDGNPDL